jgi:putative ABC transport system permease protein
MDIRRLVGRNILNRPFRSSAVLASILLVTAGASLATVILEGATDVISQSATSINALQADIVVIPRAGGAGFTSQGDVDGSILLAEISSTSGVAAVSPQQRLSAGGRRWQGNVIELVAFDPATDFAILSMLAALDENLLASDSVILGSSWSTVRDGELLDLWGYPVTVAGHLQAASEAHAQTLFITFEGAQSLLEHLAKTEPTSAPRGTGNPPVILVRVAAGTEAHEVAQSILKHIPGVSVYDHSDFLGPGRERLSGLSRSAPYIVALIWLAAAFGIALVCMVLASAHEREIGVLQALGSPRALIFQWLTRESLILACGGGLLGLGITLALVAWSREGIASFAGLPVIAPSPRQMLTLLALGAAAILPGAVLAGIYPVWRSSHRDASMALTE